jgi:hypothetical protein
MVRGIAAAVHQAPPRAAMKAAMILIRNTAMRAADIRKFPWTRYNGEQVQIRSIQKLQIACKRASGVN